MDLMSSTSFLELIVHEKSPWNEVEQIDWVMENLHLRQKNIHI